MIEQPSILDLIETYNSAIRGEKDELADLRRGSVYETIGGAAAILWSREGQRDNDLFADCKFGTQTGDVLTESGLARYGIPRILDTKGQGIAIISRPTNGGGAGTIWHGTRFQVASPLSNPVVYEVVSDVPISATATSFSVPIQAVVFGTGTAIQITVGATIIDPIWDNTWTVSSLYCLDGTNFEAPETYRARVRQTRRDSRSGYRKAIIDTCANVGASQVALFASDYGGASNDHGLNVCYVGDNGYVGNATLTKSCKLALHSVRVLGDNLQVLPMVPMYLTINADVQLYDAASKFDSVDIKRICRDALIQYISGNGQWGYRLDSMAAAIYRVIRQVQNVTFNTPNVDTTIFVNTTGINNFPDTLTRYFLLSSAITINLS